LIKKHAPSCKIIYETTDLHFLREQRQAKIEKSQSTFENAQITKQTELGIVETCDVTIVKSKEEAKMLLNENPNICAAVIPPLQIPPKEEKPGFEQRQDLLFVGGFQHPPNVDSLEYLVNKILPEIKQKLPNIKLYVIGSNPPQSIVDLCSANEDIIFLGHVREIETYLNKCRLLVTPLRYGAGVKGKITQAMSYGLPVVTTTIGAEGIARADDEILVVANEENFAEKTFAIYNDEKLWNAVSENASKCVDERFTPEVVMDSLNQILVKCLQDE